MQGEAKEYLIRKDGYFYRPNCQGYTTRKIEAGRYTKDKAEAEAAVEPWHMSAVHQDDVPDEPAVADLNAQITRLQEQVETLRKELDEMLGHFTASEMAAIKQARRAEAAEAERDRLREALEPFAEAWDVAVHHEDLVRHLTLGQLGELAAHEVSGAHFRRARAALQKEPQP